MGEKLDFSIGSSTGGNSPVKTTATTDRYLGFGVGNANNNNRNNRNLVRPAAAIGNRVYAIPFESILEAYYDCTRRKKSKRQCIEFSLNYEAELVQLHEELCAGTYRPAESTCFIVTHPVTREIIASAFRGRIVHHFIKLRLNPLYEEWYHQLGDVSKNCRKGEGPQSAVDELEAKIKAVSDNYTKDCWVLSFDIHSYFMSIDKSVLWEMTEQFIRDRYEGDDLDLLLWLVRTTAFHCPQKFCRKLSPTSAWNDLPPSKSLMCNDDNVGIAPGNLSSQDEANFYLTPLDHYIVEVKKFPGYVRFMDDGKVVSDDLERLVELRKSMDKFLQEQLRLQLHPKKIRIDHYSKGIKFVGYVLKPGRRYTTNRIIGHLYDTIYHYNRIAEQGDAEQLAERFVASINSYWGIMRHSNSYRRRVKSAGWISPLWFKYVYVAAGYEKLVLRQCYKPQNKARQMLKTRAHAGFFTPEMFK